MKKLIDIVVTELSKKDIISDNEKLQIVETIVNSIENWIIEEYNPEIQKWLTGTFAEEIQNWLIEEYTPEVLKFQYWAHKEFPKTFKSKFIKKEDNKNIEDAEYEEVDSHNGSTGGD